MSMAVGKNFGHRGLAALAGLILATGLALAHPHADDPVEYSTAELEQLVGPIALYPDDLLSVILRASTYPLQIVQAARFLQDLAENPNLEPDADWDESVVALLNYPEVIELLNEDLDWTEALGGAVIGQEPDVLDAIQDFRERALLAGNLNSDDVQVVGVEDGAIEIESIVQDVLYVPDYEPAQVIIYQSSPAYRYHAFARPVHYYPYPARHYFPSGYFWGVTTHYGIGWLDHGLHAYGLGDYRHPYFRHDYHYRQHYYRGQDYDDRDDTASLGSNRRQDDAAPTRDQPGTAIRPSKSFRPKDRGMISDQSKTRFRRGATTVNSNDKVTYHRGTYGKSKRTQPKQRSTNVSTSKRSPSKATKTKRSSTRAASSKRTVAKSQRTTTTRKTATATRSATSKRSVTINRSKPAKVTRSAPNRVNRAPPKTKSTRSSTSVKTTRKAAPTRQASTRSATRSPSRSSSAGRPGSASRSSRAATRGSKR
jgi:hypothetical protein